MDMLGLQIDDPHLLQPHNLVASLMENSRKQFEIYSSKFEEMNNINIEKSKEIHNLKEKMYRYEQKEDGLNNEFDEINSDNKALENKVRDLAEELNDARETIEQNIDMERKYIAKKQISDDLIQKLRKQNEMLSKEVEDGLKVTKEEDNRSDSKESYQIENADSKDIEDLVEEIDHLRERNKETKLLIITLGEENEQLKEDMKQLEIKDDLNKYLSSRKEENSSNMYREIDISEIEMEGIDNLKIDVEKMKSINKEEKFRFQTLAEENDMLKEKLYILQDEKTVLDMNSHIIPNSGEKNQLSLFEEFENIRENCDFINKFECESCEKTFLNNQKRLVHTQKCIQKKESQKVVDIEREVANQRMQLMKDIYEVKENEIYDRYSCNSSCYGICRIFHQKHDWKKSFSTEFLQKLENIKINTQAMCESSEKSPNMLSELDIHMQTLHEDSQCINVLDTASASKTHMHENKENQCKLSETCFERWSDMESHSKSHHDVAQCETSVERKQELERHSENNFTNIEIQNNLDNNSDSAEEYIEKRSCPDLMEEETFDDSFQGSKCLTKHLCHICLLSFTIKDELKQHVQKHTDVRPPSILKKRILAVSLKHI